MGHTAHKSEEEATLEARQMLDIYAEFAENVAGVSVVKAVSYTHLTLPTKA